MDRNRRRDKGKTNYAVVRLVRACGSKLPTATLPGHPLPGQARKSLWIETLMYPDVLIERMGQARKSLWIETG